MITKHALISFVLGTCAVSFSVLAESATPLVVIDAHNDTVQTLLGADVDFSRQSPDRQVDLPRLQEGGVTVSFFAVNVPVYYSEAEAVRRTLDYRDAMQRLFDKYRDQIELATTARQIEKIVASRKIAAVLTLEGGHQIADDLSVLRMYRRLGFVSMTLVHFKNNHWADSATSPPIHNGLTEFGHDVVREMNRIGMIVDLSHASDKTFYDALAVTTKPVIASHSSCRALVNFPRNMDDDMLRALARNGGVVGINFYAAYLNEEDAGEARRLIKGINAVDTSLSGAALDAYSEKDRMDNGIAHPTVGHATIADVVACIQHVSKVAGIDHVGIGADFDGVTSLPQGLEDVSKMPALRQALVRAGYSQADVGKIMGGNFIRVFRDVVGE